MRQLELVEPVTKRHTLTEPPPDELAQINRRLTELRAEQTSQTAKLELAQNAYLSGTASLDQFFAEQSKIALIDQSIEALTNKQAELQTARDAAARNTERQALLDQAKLEAEYSAANWNEYLQLHAEFNEFARTQSTKMVAALNHWRDRQNAFAATLNRIDPSVQRNIFSPSGWNGDFAAIYADLKQAGADADGLAIVAAANLFPPILEFSETIMTAENYQWRKSVTDKNQAEKAA